MWGTYYGYTQLLILKKKELLKTTQKNISKSK